MDEMSSIQADMWDNALMARAESAEVARQSAEIERLAAEVRGMAEAMARRSAARAEREAAAAAVVRGRDGGRDAQEGRREGGGRERRARRAGSTVPSAPFLSPRLRRLRRIHRTKWHKGGHVRRGGGMGSDEAGREDAIVEADVWAAAGMAHARAAALHQCATLDACRHSWAARSDAGDAMKKAALANGRVVGAVGGRICRGAIAESAAELRRAVDALDAAGVEFGLAAKLSKESADGWARAGAALARAGHRTARTARERSEEARKMAQTLGMWAKRTRGSSSELGRSAGEWVADTAGWRDGDDLEVDRDAWMERQGELVAVADAELSMAEAMVRRTDEAARAADGDLERVAAEAERRLAAAARAADDGGGESAASSSSSGLQEAEAALRDGVEAAGRAASGR